MQTGGVGLLVPDDFSLRRWPMTRSARSSRRCATGLSDDWVVMPDVGLVRDHRDHQLDVVLAHPREGVAVIEVKGHRVQLRHGQFVPDRGHLPVQPHVQARGNAYALRDAAARRRCRRSRSCRSSTPSCSPTPSSGVASCRRRSSRSSS